MTLVYFKKVVVETLLIHARELHPREGILLLRGKTKKGNIVVEDTLIPPFATYGRGFSSFPLHVIPIDFSIIGTAHSHPSGFPYPSIEDLNKFYGKIMVIVAFPYKSERNIAVFNREGEKMSFQVI